MDMDEVVVPPSDPIEFQEWHSVHQSNYWDHHQNQQKQVQPSTPTPLILSPPPKSPIADEDSQSLPPPLNFSPLSDSPTPISSSPPRLPSPPSQIETRPSSPPVPSTSRVTLDQAASSSQEDPDQTLIVKPQAQTALGVIPDSPPAAAKDHQQQLQQAPHVSASTNAGAYQRSFRQRKPGQINPYSLEQARYKAVLERQDWEDAVVPLKRSHELTAEELARKKEEAKKRGADDLEGWLVLEDGVRVRKEDWHEGMAAPVASSASKKRHRRNPSDAEARLQRALQGYSSESSQTTAFDDEGRSDTSEDDDDDDPRDIPPERHRPRRKRRSAVRNRYGSKRRPASPQASAAAPDSARRHKPMPDSQGSSPLPIGKASKSQTAPRKTIHLDGSSSSDEERSDEAEEPAMSSEHEKEMRSVKEDRFALKGRKKRYLKGMMPAVFMRKAERDLDLMREEQRSGRRVDYGGSGDEEDHGDDGDEDVVGVSAHQQRKGEAKRRKAYFEDGDGQLKFIADEESPDEEQYAEASWLAAAAPKKRKSRLSKGGGSGEASVPSFAPLPAQSRRQKQTRDMIDRLLVQSRAAQEEAQRRRPKKRKQKANSRNNRKQPGASVGQEGPQVSLADEDELWQVPTFLAPALAPGPTFNDIPRPDLHQALQKTKQPQYKQARDEDGAWKSFRKFSHDFQMERLDPRTFPALSPDSVLVKGHLVELSELLGDGAIQTPIRTVFPFGIPCHGDLDEEAVEGLLPRLTDAIVDSASRWLSLPAEQRQTQPRPAAEACEALHFMGLYASSRASVSLLHLIQAQLDALDRRCRSLAEEENQQAPLNYFLLSIHWACLELALRLRHAAIRRQLDVSLFASPTTRTQRLVKSLIQHGPNATGKALKANTTDLSVEFWAALLSLAWALPTTTSKIELEAPSVESIWEHLTTELDANTEANHTHPVVASEALCYAAIVLCAISQISATGHVLPTPRLQAYWPVLARSLEPVTVADLAELDRWSSVELHRRDGYLWSLFARTLVMVHRWQWVLTERDSILTKLYDILNARQLDNLAIDSGAKDFPAFLQQFDGHVGTSLEGREDSAFHIFLKLLVSVAQGILAASPTEAEARRNLNRFLMRVSPMRKLPPNSSRSMLVNHYSLFITLSIIAPWSAPQRLSQIRALLSFEAADQDTRPVLIRAMMYFALVYHHHQLALDPILIWFASAAQLLRSHYIDSDRKRAQLNAPAARPAKGMSVVTNLAEKAKNHKLLTTQLYSCALAFTLLLRAIQNIMTAASSSGDTVSFPDTCFLNSAWISSILASPVAMDPLVGTEVIKCLQTYLDLRFRAVEDLKRTEASQDDFGFDDFDFNDPALNDLIGFEPKGGSEHPASTSTASVVEATQRKDAELAKLLKNEVSPALFKLLTSLFTPSVPAPDSAPKIHQGELKADHLKDLMYAWATCASIMVYHKLRTWTSYFRFGDEACSRMSDLSARRESSMLLANAIADINLAAFASLFDEVARVWFEVVVHPSPSIPHVILTDHVLDTFSTTHALFQNISGFHPERNEEPEERTLESFAETRSQLLEEVFRNMAHMLQETTTNTGGLVTTPHQQLFTLIGQMMTAMRDHLQAFGPQSTGPKEVYKSFCGQMVMALGTSTRGQVNERTVPALRYFNSLSVTERVPSN